METCRLIKENIIPKEELDRVFKESEEAAGNMDASFLCFEDEYFEAASYIDKDMTIIDLGCAYAPQSYIFKDYTRYIGVDFDFDSAFFNRTENSEFYQMDITDFIKEKFPTLNLDTEKCVAIMCAVPPWGKDPDNRNKLVADTFPLHYIYYPGEIKDISLGKIKEKEMGEIER